MTKNNNDHSGDTDMLRIASGITYKYMENYLKRNLRNLTPLTL